MKTIEIKCDACEADLTDAGSMPTYRLQLGAEAVPNSGSIICSVAVRPDLERQYHFCGIPCLGKWMSNAHPDALARFDKVMSHRSWLAERMRKPA